MSGGASLRDEGYLVARGVFTPERLVELVAVFDEVRSRAAAGELDGLAGVRVFRGDDVSGTSAVRFVQGLFHHDARIRAFAADPALLSLLEPELGDRIRLVIDTLFYKARDVPEDHVAFHQDVGFRKPPEAFRRPDESYLQLMIAVDAHREDNGALQVVPGSHRRGLLQMQSGGGTSLTPATADQLRERGLDPGTVVTVTLDPGDVVVWRGLTVHGSAPNVGRRSFRRSLNAGYWRAQDTDAGEWAFGSPELSSDGA